MFVCSLAWGWPSSSLYILNYSLKHGISEQCETERVKLYARSEDIAGVITFSAAFRSSLEIRKSLELCRKSLEFITRSLELSRRSLALSRSFEY